MRVDDEGASAAGGEPGSSNGQRRYDLLIRVIGATMWSKFTHDNVVAWGTLVLAIATASLVLVALSTDHKYGRQVTAMELQLTNTTDNGLRQLRAYLLFDSGHIKEQGREQYRVVLSVKNSGLTPAYHVRHSWGMRIYEYPLPGPVPFGPVDFEPVNERQSADIGASLSFTLDDLRKLTITSQLRNIAPGSPESRQER